MFDDNPATQDLTGLHAVTVAVANVAVDARFETLTVGLNSPWGGGKSGTALNLIEKELRRRDGVGSWLSSTRGSSSIPETRA